MSAKYLHEHLEFKDLLQSVAEQLSILPILVEKDYWIMHCLYGLKKQGFSFYMKGGTSLSKGFKIIDRFSEDIDILIEPPLHIQGVKTSKNQNKPIHCESRKNYFDWLADNIKIDGLVDVERDTSFDDEKFRNGGIKLIYPTLFGEKKDVKRWILLEVGFDNISPNEPITISSWAYDAAVEKISIKDNIAKGILCYHPGYTFVEKLHAISNKFRQQQERGYFASNFMRHYYDLYCLLDNDQVNEFIGTPEYKKHKESKFKSVDKMDMTKNQAIQMNDQEVFKLYEGEYNNSQTLYYAGKPEFREIIDRLKSIASKL